MNTAFKPLLVVFAMVLVMAGFSYWQKSSAAHDDTGVPWRKSFADARRESAETQRPVLLYFTASWCPPCQQMKAQTWPDAGVKAALENYVPVKVDVDESPDLARQFGVSSIPRVQVVRPDGAPGASRGGFIPAAELIRWLHGA
jgi:thiol:disulfide interchange protein